MSTEGPLNDVGKYSGASTPTLLSTPKLSTGDVDKLLVSNLPSLAYDEKVGQSSNAASLVATPEVEIKAFLTPSVVGNEKEIQQPPPVAGPGPVTPVLATDNWSETASLRNMRMFTSAVTLFLGGWNMGATGALLPYIEKAYGLDYSEVAILFICTFLGYTVAALSIGPASRRIGYGPTLICAVVFGLVGSILNSCQQASFVPMCFGFCFFGFAFAGELSLINAYFALLPKPLVYTGVLHGIFGLGAFASPLVATTMVTKGVPYHFFYMTCLGMSVPVLALVWFSFRTLHSLPQTPEEIISTTRQYGLRDTLRSRTVWTLALFEMFYVGAEESIGGWIVTYVLKVRNGSPSSASWVASTFYLGLAVGRMVLPVLNVRMGERRAVFVYLAFALALEAIAWAVPSYSSTAAATALIGLAVSTFYTAGIVMASHLVPRSMHADAFSVMCSIGQSGSAFFPLIVGIIATKKGIWVVEPAVVALLAASGVMWFLAPSRPIHSA